jgi:ribosomal protein L7/L12
MASKKYKFKAGGTDSGGYIFQCNDEAKHLIAASFLKSLFSPQISNSATALIARSGDPFGPTRKSPEALSWHCITIPSPDKKIQAIKIFRDITHHSLADSKHWCERSRSLKLEMHEAGELWEQGFMLCPALPPETVAEQK